MLMKKQYLNSELKIFKRAEKNIKPLRYKQVDNRISNI